MEPEGRITHGDLGLYSDANERALGRVLEGIRRYSTMPIGIQLGHAGRKASSARPWEGGQQVTAKDGGWITSGPSAEPVKSDDELPVSLDSAGLVRVRDAFVAAAKRSVRLGLQAIELHAAHGYLLHQFLSPIANKRNDEYGGPLANRMRFPLEMFQAVRDVVPAEIPVGVRVSATDWVEHGWDLEQTIEFTHALKPLGCDFMDVSSGGVSPAQQIPLGPGYQVEFAAKVRAATGLPIDHEPGLAPRSVIPELRVAPRRVVAQVDVVGPGLGGRSPIGAPQGGVAVVDELLGAAFAAERAGDPHGAFLSAGWVEGRRPSRR